MSACRHHLAALLLGLGLGLCACSDSPVSPVNPDADLEVGLGDGGAMAADSSGQSADQASTAPDQAAPTLDGKPGEFILTMAGRTYRLLVPSGYTAATPIALLVGFHGAGDSGANFYAICKAVGFAAAAGPANFILLVPDTKSPYQDFAIWTGNPNNDLPQMQKEMDEIVAIIADVSSHYRVDAKRIHAFGFSDGGLFTAIAGMHRADFFGSLAICGFGWGSSYPLVTPARKIAAQFVCGQNDSFFSKAQSSASFLQSAGHPTRFLAAADVGHLFSGLMKAHPPADLFAWMEQNPLP